MNAPAVIPVDAPGARRIAKNALASFLRGGVTVPLGLVVTALVLGRLGPAALGLWSLMGTFTSPMVPLSFGIATSLVRQVAIHRGDPRALTGLVSTCLLMYGLILAGLVALYLVGAAPLHAWLSARSGLPLEQTRLATHFTALSFIVILGTLTFTAALNGLEDFPSAQAAVTANHVLLAALVVIFVTPGASIVQLFQATTAASLLQGLLQVVLLRRRLGFWPLDAREISGARARVLISEGSCFFALDSYRFCFYLVDKWVITAYLGSAAAGYYELGSRLGTILRGLLNTLASPLLAASAAASSSPLASEKLERLTFYSLRYMAVAAVPLALFVVSAAPAILAVWVGAAASGPDAVTTLRYMVPAYLVNAFTVASLYLVAGHGRTRAVMIASAGAILLNLALDIAAMTLDPSLGSLVLASFLASALTGLGLLAYQAGVGTLPARRLVRSGGAVLVSGVISVPSGELVRSHLVVLEGAPSRFAEAAAILLTGAVATLLYLILLRFLGEFDDQDRYFFSTGWKGFRT